MRTQRFGWRLSVSLLFFAAVTTAHAERIEDFPLLLPSTTLYGDCGPVPRCFPKPDDLKPDTAVIGSSGQASIYVRQTTGDWQLQAALLDPFAPLPRPYYNSNFGYLASLDSSLLAVAATPPDGPAHVIYLFARHESQWSLLQTITVSPSFGDLYLRQIELQDGMLAVSQLEYATDTSGRIEAKVLVYSVGSDGQFHLRQQLDPAQNPEPDVAYGVAINNRTLALATPANGDTVGAVYIYQKTRTAESYSSRWRLHQVLQPRQLTPSAQFASAISLSDDTLAVAAPGVINSPPTLYPGAIFIYGQNGNRWILQNRIVDPVTESDPPSESNSPPSENPFGTMLALSGKRLLVKHISNAYAGEWSTAILFELQQRTWTPVARLGGEDVSNTFNVQNTLLAGATALVSEAPYDGIFPAAQNVYELPALTSAE